MTSRTLLALAACALLSGTAHAQTRKSAGAEKPVPAQSRKSADAEKLEAAADNLARMKTSLKHVLGRAEQARNDRDVVKLNCVNEKLTQIKSLIKGAEQADIQLHDSISRATEGEAEFSKIAIARTKVDRLRGEAEQCVGQLAYMVDEKTVVEVEAPGNLPGQRAAGLGVANREANPADSVASLGFGPGADHSGFPGYSGRTGQSEPGCRSGTSGCGYQPPPITRPPAASPYR